MPYSDYMNPMFMMPFIQGQNAAQGISNSVNQGFALANALSSANRQASYGPEASVLMEQEKTKRMNAILPQLMQILGNGGLGSAGAGGFTTNYGASASYAPRHPGGGQPDPSQSMVANQPLSPQLASFGQNYLNRQQRPLSNLPNV